VTDEGESFPGLSHIEFLAAQNGAGDGPFMGFAFSAQIVAEEFFVGFDDGFAQSGRDAARRLIKDIANRAKQRFGKAGGLVYLAA
jgi:hypothetical protein